MLRISPIFVINDLKKHFVCQSFIKFYCSEPILLNLAILCKNRCYPGLASGVIFRPPRHVWQTSPRLWTAPSGLNGDTKIHLKTTLNNKLNIQVLCMYALEELESPLKKGSSDEEEDELWGCQQLKALKISFLYIPYSL